MQLLRNITTYLKFLRLSNSAKHEYSNTLRAEYETFLDNFIDKDYGLGDEYGGYLEPGALSVSISQKNYSLIQSRYLTSDYKLVPNLRIYADDSLFFQINSWGLKGSAPSNEGKKIVIWGDSVVFGFGRTWCDLKSVDGTQSFSGGLEGASADNIIDYAFEINSMYAIDGNVISLGWHSMGSKEKTNELLAMTETLPNRSFLTLPYSIPLHLASQNIENQFNTHADVGSAYLFWGNHKYSPLSCFKLIHDMQYQNSLIRKYAKKYKLPLLDLEEIFASKKATQIDKLRFFDVGHPRPSAYPFLAHSLMKFIGANYES
jgi:hypothetical protein